MKKYILLLAVLLFLCGVADAIEIPNPGVIHSGETFTIHENESLMYGETLVIEKGGTLIVEPYGSVYVSIDNSGHIDNYGTFDCTIHNSGIIENFGHISFGHSLNSGTISSSGSMYTYSVINNTGIMLNSGDFFNEWTLENFGKFSNSGDMYTRDGHIRNFGNFDNSGNISVSYYTEISNSGTLTNSGVFEIDEWCSISNSGTIDNSGTVFSVNGYIYNEGIINNLGRISHTENYDWNGIAEFITNNGAINIYKTSIITGSITGNPLNAVIPTRSTFKFSENRWLDGGLDPMINIRVEPGATFIIDTPFDCSFSTLDNYGIVIIEEDSSISIVPGTINNYGNFEIYGKLYSDGYINNHVDGIMHNYGFISNMLGFDNYGAFYMHPSGYITGGNLVGNPIIYVDSNSESNVPVTSVTVTGAATSVENGKTLQMTATVIPATATNKDVTWSVISGTGAATISQTGLLTGAKEGTVTVRAAAKDGSGVEGSSVVTITAAAVPVTSISVSGQGGVTVVENGKTLQMTATVNPTTATNKAVTWSVTSGTGTATISPTGLLTATKAGTVTVKATSTDGSGVEGSMLITVAEEIVPVTSITVTGAATTVENGKTLQMTATVTPATATNKDVAWSVVAGTGNAIISPTGLLKATKSGTVTVKAIAKDGSGVQGSSVITVIEMPVTGISLSEAVTTVETGKTLQMIATVYSENATNKNVLWSVESVTGDAVISQTGLLTGKAAGNVTVIVTSVANSNVKDTLNITVTAAKTVSSSGGGGGGGSGGSGSSGEKIQNIALKDVSSIFVAKGAVKFDFKDADNDIQYIEYTALKNSGTITATVEILKDKSTFAASSPKGVIYRHINIWLGKTGYATETNIEGPVIGFRVDKNWIDDKGIDPASVTLSRYSGDKWNALSTTQTGYNGKYYYYQAKTPGFSPFAITGVSLDEAALRSTSNTSFAVDDGNVQESSAGNETKAENKLPGLSLTVTLLIVSFACFLFRKQ